MAWNPNIPTVTNRVQDDLNAIRENFQHLNQLAERVDELQTVSELAPIANDVQAVSGLAQAVDELQAVSELAPYIQALLDGRIVEMGSNANGEYVRWENGLQICVHTGPTFSVDASSYELYQWSQFPASFDEVWVVLGSSTTTGGAVSSRLTRGTLGVLEGTYRVWMVNDSTEVRQMTPHFLAVGRWK